MAIYGHDNQGGVYQGGSYSDKTFYGFHLDSVGDAKVTIIRSSDSDVIDLPYVPGINNQHPGILADSALDSLSSTYTFIDKDAYKTWLWSVDALTFRWNNNTGHLEMVVY